MVDSHCSAFDSCSLSLKPYSAPRLHWPENCHSSTIALMLVSEVSYPEILSHERAHTNTRTPTARKCYSFKAYSIFPFLIAGPVIDIRIHFQHPQYSVTSKAGNTYWARDVKWLGLFLRGFEFATLMLSTLLCVGRSYCLRKIRGCVLRLQPSILRAMLHRDCILSSQHYSLMRRIAPTNDSPLEPRSEQ